MSQNNLGFLQEKIHELRSALFFNTGNAVLKFPTCIITALKVDEAGQVWFFVNRPEQCLHEFDKEFPARLDFFRKGKQFYLQITGKAFIVTDPVELKGIMNVPDTIGNEAADHLALIKFKMMHAEYFNRAIPNTTGFQKKRFSFGKWLFREKPVNRAYRLAPSY